MSMKKVVFFMIVMAIQQFVAAAQCQQQEQGLWSKILSGYNDAVNTVTGKDEKVKLAAAAVKQAEYELALTKRNLDNIPTELSVEDRAVEEYKLKEVIKKAEQKVAATNHFLQQASRSLGFSYKNKLVKPLMALIAFEDLGGTGRLATKLIDEGVTSSFLSDAVKLVAPVILLDEKLKLPPVVKFLGKKTGMIEDQTKELRRPPMPIGVR